MISHNDLNASSPRASTDRLATWLIQRAALRAPAELGERLAEEYQADLVSQRAGLARLRFAGGCYWASLRMSFDPMLCSARRVVAAGGPNAQSIFAPHDSTFLSRRTLVFMAILAVHVAAIYVLVSARVGNAKPLAPPPNTEATVLVKLPTEEPLPRFPYIAVLTTVSTHTTDIPPPPNVRLGPTPEASSQADGLLPSEGDIEARAVKRLAGGPGAGFPDVRDYYSAAAIRAGQVGVTAVRVCVDGRGRLTSTPAIAMSSGYPILDGDALAVAKAGSGHYRSTTEDGVAISDCYSYRIRFELH